MIYSDRLSAIRALLSRFRFKYSNEAELQSAIEKILEGSSFAAVREVRLGEYGRLDFLVDGDIAIETKIGGSTQQLMRQVARYALSDRVSAILVITDRANHVLPESFNGKPVMVYSLMDGAF